MPLDTWLLFVVTVFFVSATPGPNMLLALSHGIRYGTRGALMTCAGLLSGLALFILASALGLGALMVTSEPLFLTVKYLGAAYLVWLGIRTWRAPAVPLQATDAATQNDGETGWQRFRTGFLVALSNPKALVFFGALFPQFVSLKLPQAPQWLVLALTFYLIESTWQLAYASGGARLSRWLNSPQRVRWLNRFAGGSFLATGLALSTVNRH